MTLESQFGRIREIEGCISIELTCFSKGVLPEYQHLLPQVIQLILNKQVFDYFHQVILALRVLGIHEVAWFHLSTFEALFESIENRFESIEKWVKNEEGEYIEWNEEESGFELELARIILNNGGCFHLEFDVFVPLSYESRYESRLEDEVALITFPIKLSMEESNGS